jgi:TolB-like protein
VLVRCVSELRKVLDDDAKHPRFIETIHKGGYRLIADVEWMLEDSRRGGTVSPSRSLRRSVTIAVLAIAAVLVVYTGWRLLRTPTAASAERLMLAVLPFENLSGNPEQEYVSDGFTEELIAQLGSLRPERLGVDYILEGSVRRESNRVRITTQLIEVADQTHLWAKSYDRDLSHVFAVQNEVSELVAGALALELLPAQKAQLSREVRVDPEVYDAYRQGRFALAIASTEPPGSISWRRRAIRHFQHAIELDPGHAAAYAWMGRAYIGLEIHGGLSPQEAFPLARAALEKALELDGEAHGGRVPWS